MHPNHDQPTYSDNDIQNAGQPPEPKPLAPTPVAHDYLHPIQDKPKHAYHPKRMMIVLSSIVAVSLIAVAIMLIYALSPTQQNKKTNGSDQSNKSAPQKDTLTAKQTVKNVAIYFKGQEKPKSPISRPVMAPGKAFYTVIPDVPPLVGIAGPVSADKSDMQLESILKAMDYDKFAKKVREDGANNTNYLADLTRDDVICQVQVIKQKDVNAEHWTELRCLDMGTYAEYAETQQPLATLYTPLTASSVQYGFVGKPMTKPSQTDGYTHAELPVSTVIDNTMTSSNRLALFYQSPDKLWRYFTDRDSNLTVECEQYDTPNLKTAYANETCRRVKTGASETIIPPKKR